MLRMAPLLLFALLLASCKVHVVVPNEGEVSSSSGNFDCGPGETCVIDVVDLFFDETFTAVANSGHDFGGWKMQARGFCGGSVEPCRLATAAFAGSDVLMGFLSSDEVFYLEPEFSRQDTPVDEESQGVGYEVLEPMPDGSFRVWLTLGISAEQFDAIDLPSDWIRNQPRVGDADGGQFFRSPLEARDGVYVSAQLYGYNWVHVASVVEQGIVLDDQGLLFGTLVAKFHEVTFDAGRTLVVLLSPEGDAYVRISRDLNRTFEVPSLPEGWSLVEYVTDQRLTFMLPNETLVIRGNNQDSFQGPVPLLAELLESP